MEIDNTHSIVTPFIKWAGGKSKLIKTIIKYIPNDIDNYYEPFIGSGAMYLYLKSIGKIKGISFINDINSKLIITYSAVKHNPSDLIQYIDFIDTDQAAANLTNKEMYYHVRNVFNEPSDDAPINTAAFFIYLNKTCFNGLYRENSKGEFNTPMGNYRNPKIYDRDNILSVSKILNDNTVMSCIDFYDINVIPNSFVYLDPPYYPLNRHSFVQYTNINFLEKEQIKVKNYIDKLNKANTKFLLSNSYCDFNLTLYKDYKIDIIKASRSINSDIEQRGKVSEILVRNY